MPPIGDGVNGMPSGNQFSDSRFGAGFQVGFDDGEDDDPDGGVMVDPGVYSQIRIVGIGANETTGQQRVPVKITSLRDDTLGKTVRGVDMFQALSGNTTAPAAGDGGVIGFGANMLTDYNLYDPRDGSIIDNADIRYITRIEMQGGGIVDDGTGFQPKLGLTPDTQFNSAKAMTVSNTNFSDFSQVGFLSHDSGVNALARPAGSRADPRHASRSADAEPVPEQHDRQHAGGHPHRVDDRGQRRRREPGRGGVPEQHVL